MVKDVYEFSFKLSKEQGLTPTEHGLLGRIMIEMSKHVNKIPIARMSLILEHLVKVNDFMIENDLPEPTPAPSFRELVKETGNFELLDLFDRKKEDEK